MNYTQISKPFSHWLANLDELDGWLYVSKQEPVLTPETICHCISISNEVSPEEQDAAEIEISKQDLVIAFERAGVEMVISNLLQQIPEFTQIQCMEALNYYWHNDAYQRFDV